MNDWKISDLEAWDNKIIDLAKSYNLDWFPINYEICDYYEMIGHMSYHGLPSHYSHWSYGKSFERTHQMYNMGLEGLPYELIINSNPSIAYLMRENPLFMQVLIMAHCVGHSDFFKNNPQFKDTRPEAVLSKFRNARNRIQKYIEDPSIGVEKVEKILDAAHSIRFQTYRDGQERIPHSTQKSDLTEKIKLSQNNSYDDLDVEKIPLNYDVDLLGFIVEHGTHLSDWERDLVSIVREESLYFIPQIRTKILNEGWASFWHYKMMHELELPQSIHLPFLKTHNQVVRPHVGGVNPYHVGFHLFQKIEKEQGLSECFFVREVFHDVAAIRALMTRQDFIDLNMFSYSPKRNAYTIDDISDEEGWENVREKMILNTGTSSIPVIGVSEIEPGNVLVLHHDHDGRDLELGYAEQVVKNISTLWEDVVKLNTVIEEEPWEI
ncbi:SpoVR family protein [bacterium]|nr:SpoVR family protein [bacterium]